MTGVQTCALPISGGYIATAAGHEFGEEVSYHGRRQTRGIRVDQEKKRRGRKQRAALAEEWPEVFFEFPHFARGAATVGRRVHDDGVVEFAALLFAADEFEAVVGDVADGCVDRPLRTAFSLHHLTMPSAASIWVTLAPALAAAQVAAPV